MAKIVRTVLGDIAPEDLGYTTLHDHTLINMSQAGEYMQQMFWDRTPESLAFGPENYVSIKDGSYLANPEMWECYDVGLYAKEFGYFKALGGQSVFDPSPIGIRGPIAKIQELSRKTGLNIISATGLYHETTIPPEYLDRGEDFYYQLFMDEIENGIEGTEVRPGAVKCAINQVSQNEVDVINACVRISAETGMSCHMHTEPTVDADDIYDTMEAAVERYGADRTKIVVLHMDNRIASGVFVSEYLEDEDVDRTLDLELQRKLLAKGYNIGLDTWCLPVVNPNFFMPDLFERTKALCLLCAEGYTGQISLGNDFSGKICMRTYGEYGPTAFEEFGLKMLEMLDHEDWVHTLVYDNPARILAFEG